MRSGAALTAVVIGVFATQVALAEEGEDATVISPAAQQVFVDPDTGELVTGPIDIPQVVPIPEAISSTSHVGLYEVASPVPGGGVKIDLQGRFQSTLSVTLDPEAGFRFAHED